VAIEIFAFLDNLLLCLVQQQNEKEAVLNWAQD
jgi:hypothetical protein